MKKYLSLKAYFSEQEIWRSETNKLREIVIATGVDEALKWGMPVYSAYGKNVVGIGASQTYFGLWFYQGALLADSDRVLINAQEGKTKAMRQWRFQSAREVKVRLVKKYILEAVALAEQGKQVKPNRNMPVVVPPELEKVLAENPGAKKCFDSLSKSCRREYANYVAEAKKAETKVRRISKIIPMILDSVGLNDKYRNC